MSLFTDLRAGLGPNARITVASQASKPLEIEMAIAALDPLVDGFHLMTYDYAVSDITGTVNLSPNAPLYTPSAAGAVQMSVNYTVSNYLAAGIHPSKIFVGIAMCVDCAARLCCVPPQVQSIITTPPHDAHLQKGTGTLSMPLIWAPTGTPSVQSLRTLALAAAR